MTVVSEKSPTPEIKTRILDAATRIFADRGYGMTSVQMICDAVGVTKPTLYYYFPSKESLYLSALQSHIDAMAHVIQDMISREGTIREKLLSYVKAYLDFFIDHPDRMRFLMTAVHRPDKGQPAVDLFAMHARNGELLARLIFQGVQQGRIRHDIDPIQAVLMLQGMLDLHCVGCLHHLPLPTTQLPERILDLFLRGVSVP